MRQKRRSLPSGNKTPTRTGGAKSSEERARVGYRTYERIMGRGYSVKSWVGGGPTAVRNASFVFVFSCIPMLAGKSRPDLLAPSTDELPGPGSVHPSESGPPSQSVIERAGRVGLVGQPFSE